VKRDTGGVESYLAGLVLGYLVEGVLSAVLALAVGAACLRYVNLSEGDELVDVTPSVFVHRIQTWICFACRICGWSDDMCLVGDLE